MDPILDIRTLVLIYVGIRTGQAVMLVYLWTVQRNYPPAKDWAIGALLSALGLLFSTFRGNAPVLLSEVVSNALLLPGWMLFDIGIARAAGKMPSVSIGSVFCGLALGLLAWMTVVERSQIGPVVVQNLFFVSCDIYAAYACLSVKESGRSITFKLIGVLLIISVIACAWRVAGGAFGLTMAFDQTLPRLLWIATSLVTFPMITMLLTLHTSQRLQEEIRIQARKDALTGAFNRRALDEFAEREWARSVRHGYPFSLLSVDIDHFKQFNDQHGHQVGDATLTAMSHASQLALRSNDIWCRYGGEEFVALLPNTTIEQAVVVAERLRLAVEQTTISAPGGLLNVSVSIGVAERGSHQTAWADVLATSDTALYQAKAAGRNCVMAESSLATAV